MKKTIWVLLLTMTGYLIGCNDVSKNVSNTATSPSAVNTNKRTQVTNGIPLDIDCIGNADFYIADTTAQRMINHLKKYFHTSVNPAAMAFFDDSVWIDACVINALGNFFDTAKNDGLRIYFGAEFTPSRNKKNTILLIPTYPGTTAQKLHDDDLVTKPNLVCNNAVFQNFNRPSTYTSPLIEQFDLLYRGRQSATNTRYKNISSAVWLSKCTFIYLRNLIKRFAATTQPLDGITVYFAAYQYIEKGTYQTDSNQTTLVVVPTNKDGNNHKPNWDVVQKSTTFIGDADKINKWLDGGGALNHGQLCPTQCN